MKMSYIFVALAVLALLVLAGCGPKVPAEPVAPTAPAEPAPVEPAAPTEEVAEETLEEPAVEPVSGSEASKEEGMLKSVACDFDAKKITLTVTNPSEEDWNFYEKVVPQPENSMKTILNGRLLVDMSCDSENLPAGETATCTASDVVLRVADRDTQNRLSVTGPDRSSDQLEFSCLPAGEEVLVEEAPAEE